jgi:hypothetical protein
MKNVGYAFLPNIGEKEARRRTITGQNKVLSMKSECPM